MQQSLAFKVFIYQWSVTHLLHSHCDFSALFYNLMRYIFDPPSLYKFLLPKTELGLILLCYFYNLTAQLLAAWHPQVSTLLLPDLPLSVWVQDRSNIQLLYCVIWQPLYSAPAWIYWAEQTVVCQEVSPQKNIGFTIAACHPSFRSSIHRNKTIFPQWPGLTNIDDQDAPSQDWLVSAPPGLRAIWTHNHETWLLFLLVLSAEMNMS